MEIIKLPRGAEKCILTDNIKRVLSAREIEYLLRLYLEFERINKEKHQ